MIGVIVYRVLIIVVLPEKYAGIITSITSATINLIIIIILSRLYAWLAVKLTDLGIRLNLSKKCTLNFFKILK